MPKLITPEHIKALASEFGIDLKLQPRALGLLRQALETPLPPNWTCDGDKYRNLWTGEESFVHPLTDHFRKTIDANLQEDDKRKLDHSQNEGDGIFMEFYDANGNPYFYDFRSNQAVHVPFVNAEKGRESFHSGADETVINTGASTSDDLKRVRSLRFFAWWNENKGLAGPNRRQMKITFDIDRGSLEVAVSGCSDVLYISHLSGKNGDCLRAWDLHVGAKVNILGRPTTLMQAAAETILWLEYHVQTAKKLKGYLEKEVAKYDLLVCKGIPDRCRTAVDTGQRLCTVCIASLLKSAQELQAKLESYRPSAAARIVSREEFSCFQDFLIKAT